MSALLAGIGDRRRHSSPNKTRISPFRDGLRFEEFVRFPASSVSAIQPKGTLDESAGMQDMFLRLEPRSLRRGANRIGPSDFARHHGDLPYRDLNRSACFLNELPCQSDPHAAVCALLSALR